MLTESARVTRRLGNRVELELQRGSACAGCDLNQGCGTGALGRLLGRRSRPLVIETERKCNPGDEVLLVLPEASLVRASLLIYGLPLLGMLLAGLVAATAGVSELVVVLASVLGFIVGLRVAAFIAGRLEPRAMAPYISEVRLNSSGLERS